MVIIQLCRIIVNAYKNLEATIQFFLRLHMSNSTIFHSNDTFCLTISHWMIFKNRVFSCLLLIINLKLSVSERKYLRTHFFVTASFFDFLSESPIKNSFARAKKDHDKVTQKKDHLITNHVLDCLEPYLEAIFLSKSFRVINVSSYHWRIWRFSRNYRKLDLGHETRRSQFTLYTHF